MLNIVICDDDTDFREVVEYKVRNCLAGFFETDYDIQIVSDLNQLAEVLADTKVDVLFLDIMVNNENSMNWSINNIRSSYTQIIFMTSFPASAYNISDSNCCYFLIKSKMTDEKIEKALKRALQNSSQRNPESVIIKSGSKNHIISYRDILYLETTQGNNIKMHITGGKEITIHTSLSKYQAELPLYFLRCHQSYIVNLNQIETYEPHKLILKSGEKIPVPPKKYGKIIKQYQSYLLTK